MAQLTTRNRAILFCFLYLTLAATVLCQCNTDQNPYCAGQAQFEQLCCTYPDICYWSNRAGTPACCQAGADCRADGGPAPSVVAFTAVQQTTYLVQSVYTTTTPQYLTSTYYVTSTPTTTTYCPPSQLTSLSTVVTPAVVVVTATSSVVAPAETNNNVFVTVTQVQVVAGASKMRSGGLSLLKIFGASFLVHGLMLVM